MRRSPVPWSLILGLLVAAPALAQIPAPKPPPLPPPVAQNRPPTVHARCEPCTIIVGRTSTVTADAQDPDGDPLTTTSSPPAVSLSNASPLPTASTPPLGAV